jgi:gamma-glutamyltranspeptidase / glutathione hydrolase
VTEILNILENFKLKSLDEPTRLHVIAEAMKLAFADRAYWLGDPDFVDVPRGLVDKKYAAELAGKIDLLHDIEVTSHGLPSDWQTNIFKKHTTHFSVADDEGNWVANFFGLVGAEANAVAPGKRPLSSMSPTIVLKDKQPILALGAAGGPTIISQVVLNLVNILDLDMAPETAIAQPRIHHQWSPDELSVERSLPETLKVALEKRGHKLAAKGMIGVTQIVAREPNGKGFVGVADPRAGGNASGW